MAKGPFEKQIMKKLQKAFKNAIRETAEELAWEIENAYENSLDAFYEDYTPQWYERTYSTYLASPAYNDIFGEKNLKQISDEEYKSGFGYPNSKYIPGDPYRAEKSWVYPRVFEKGIHGKTRNEALEWREKYDQPHGRQAKRKKGKYISKYKSGRTKGTVFYFAESGIMLQKYRRANSWVKKMSPPPKKLMDRQMKEIKNPDHIDGIYSNNIQKHLDKLNL